MLYKYYPLVRRDVLENGLIRFTQPSELNDPFELHPSFDLMSKADIAALPEAPGQEGNDGPKARLLTPEVMQAMMNAIRPGMEKEMARHSGQSGTFLLDNNRMAQATFDSKFGVLCLTETPDSLLMWAHYANNHHGFVIQFDETHEFFAQSSHDGEALELTKVEYSTQRLVLSYSTINSASLYYRKSTEWAYENEWRIIKPLSAAKIQLPHAEFPKHLFELPPSAIKGVILGQSISHTDRVNFFELLAKPHLKHINIYQTALSKNEYKLEIHPPLDGKYPPDALSGVVCEAR